MADLTRCRNTTIDAEAELPTDALRAWKARGWEPITESRSESAAEAERVDAENAAAETAPPKPRTAPATRHTGTTAGDAGTKGESK